MSNLVLAHNCCLARMLPGEAELVSEWTGLSARAKSFKRFERSNGLDTALYKNYLYLYLYLFRVDKFCLGKEIFFRLKSYKQIIKYRAVSQKWRYI